MENNYKIDPLTSEQFIPKKSSQRFARPENRIKHHNQKASILKQERDFLDRYFRKNHMIIKAIYVVGGENIFNSFWMEGKGFRFDATNHRIEYLGKYVNCVYEFILIEIEGTDNIQIIKNDRL